jgi:predicted nucleic acid-binding protein
MLLPDVNVLVYAHPRDAVDHARYRDWLEGETTARRRSGSRIRC